MPVSSGPYLSAGFLCEKVLRETDGVLSAIRIVDRWNIVGPTETMLPTVIQANLVVLFKSGIFRGPAQLTVTPIAPNDQRLQAIAMPLFFEGDEDRGAGIVLPIGFPVQEPGLYWFEVAISERVMTSIPLRVVYLQSTAMPAAPTTTPGQ